MCLISSFGGTFWWVSLILFVWCMTARVSPFYSRLKLFLIKDLIFFLSKIESLALQMAGYQQRTDFIYGVYQETGSGY